MADYISKYTGQQIDDVISVCRKTDSEGNSTLYYLGNLIDIISMVKDDNARLNSLLDENGGTVQNIYNTLNTKLSKYQDTMIGQYTYEISGGTPENGPEKALININSYGTYNPIVNSRIQNGSISFGIRQSEGDMGEGFYWYKHTDDGDEILASVTSYGVFGAVSNDFAEYRESDEKEAGRVICENGDGSLSRSYKRLQPGASIVSDTFGFAIGQSDKCKTPIAIAGRVLAYPYEDQKKFKPGDSVCAGPNGTISKMSRREIRKYPDRIIGIVSELPNYEKWGKHDIKVNGRIWIKVK